MILLIGSQKGGCGKSTIATNISATLAIFGHDVVLVDADRQSSATRWARDREEKATLAPVHSVQKYDNIRATLLDLNQRYGYVVVDAAGHDSKELRTGATAADILITPFRPSQQDLDTLPYMSELIDTARETNAFLKAYGLITMAPTNPAVQEEAMAKDYIGNFHNIKLISEIVRDRKVYRDAMSEGLGVVEMNNEKAKSEIGKLVLEVTEHGYQK